LEMTLSIKLFLTSAFLLISCTHSVPVSKEEKKAESDRLPDNVLPDVSYRQYLSEVISAMESDKEFANRLRSMNDSDEMANQLEFASHSVRNRLDEIKRQEVERLNELEKALEDKLALKANPGKASRAKFRFGLQSLDEATIKRAHLDHSKPHTFEIADLQKLINQVTQDIDQVDQAREAEYKRYEMGKEHSRRARLRRIKDKKAREAAEQQMRAERERHRRHERVHQPGSREQLKEAWEKGDRMDRDSFDPKAFFMLHDINGDGHMDVNEIEALFWKELDKVYSKENDTTVDRVERQHEMERMRRAVLMRLDKNKDRMVSWEEFNAWISSQEANKDEEWKTAEESDEDKPFNEEELRQFEEQYNREHPDEGIDNSQQTGP
ncbi:hypothetical protein BOX15_Mlig034413g4, partial [Macrostomum lignano]